MGGRGPQKHESNAAWTHQMGGSTRAHGGSVALAGLWAVLGVGAIIQQGPVHIGPVQAGRPKVIQLIPTLVPPSMHQQLGRFRLPRAMPNSPCCSPPALRPIICTTLDLGQRNMSALGREAQHSVFSHML